MDDAHRRTTPLLRWLEASGELANGAPIAAVVLGHDALKRSLDEAHRLISEAEAAAVAVDAPAMAALILETQALDKAIASAKAAGGTIVRPATKFGTSLSFAIIKDPDGNQVELVMPAK